MGGEGAVVDFVFDLDDDVAIDTYEWMVEYDYTINGSDMMVAQMPVMLDVSNFYMPADFNGNGAVGPIDLYMLGFAWDGWYDPETGAESNNWNEVCNIGIYTSPDQDAEDIAPGMGADFDGTGFYRVNFADLTIFARYYGMEEGGTLASIPSTVDVQNLRSAPNYQLGSDMIEEGREYTVDLMVSDIVGLFSTDIRLEYDANQFEIVSVTEGSFMGNDGTPTFFRSSDEDGVLQLVMSRLGAVEGDVSGDGVLASITLRANYTGHSNMTIKSMGYVSASGQTVAGSETELQMQVVEKGMMPEISVPAQFDLAQNAPNPFNPVTMIKYQLAEETAVQLEVYNAAGQLVKTLVNDTKPAGYYEATWTGVDEYNNPVASGVYIYRISAGDFTMTRTMVLLK